MNLKNIHLIYLILSILSNWAKKKKKKFKRIDTKIPIWYKHSEYIKNKNQL